ncbi:MAG TPA: hypothetical protein PLB56_15915 [Spirochaetales bacterium]|nr:hypothetical protein [Spirochaetales bacterium]
MTLTLFTRDRNGRLSYYTLHDRQPSLDGLPVLTSAWRVEGGRERERRYSFSDERDRDRALRRLFTRAVRRGYTLLYSFDRSGIGRFGGGPADAANAAAAMDAVVRAASEA